RGGRGGQQEGSGRTAVRVNASSDDRTNTVVVAGPPDTLAIIDKVLKDLDANPASEETVFIYHLRNADAENVSSVVNYLFNATAGSTPTRTGGSTGSSGRSGYGGIGTSNQRSSYGSSGSGFGGSSGSRLGGGS